MSTQNDEMQLYRVAIWYVAIRWATRKAQSARAFTRRATRRQGGRIDLVVLACSEDDAQRRACAWFHGAVDEDDASIRFGAGGRDALRGTIAIDSDKGVSVCAGSGAVVVL